MKEEESGTETSEKLDAIQGIKKMALATNPGYGGPN